MGSLLLALGTPRAGKGKPLLLLARGGCSSIAVRQHGNRDFLKSAHALQTNPRVQCEFLEDACTVYMPGPQETNLPGTISVERLSILLPSRLSSSGLIPG